MLNKLYSIKKKEVDGVIAEKIKFQKEIENIEKEIFETYKKINESNVDKIGKISEFEIISVYKKSLKMHIATLNKEKIKKNKEIENLIDKIIELQKEVEQYGYLIDEEKTKKVKEFLKNEANLIDEFVQSKYFKN